MAYCTQCQDLIDHLFKRSRYQRPADDFSSLRGLVQGFPFRTDYRELYSVVEECSLCAFVKAELPDEDVARRTASSKEEKTPVSILASGRNAPGTARKDGGLQLWELRASMHRGTGFASGFSAMFSVTAEKGSSAADIGDVFGTNPLLNPPISDVLSIVKTRFDECVFGHTECLRDKRPDTVTATKPKLPPRILDVTCGPEPSNVRLIESHGMQADYAALSHCWGPPTKQPLRTTKATLPQHLDGLNLSQLPQTFRDAVHVTRAVGLQYLWIDSLCIIQDDAQCWAEESPHMGQLYNDADLVIAATGASNSTEGCFVPRVAAGNSLDIPYVRDDGVTDGVVQLSRNHHAYDSIYEWGPLSMRGWVLQEWALARRIVHFTGKGTLWSCRTLGSHNICEDGSITNSTFTRDWDEVVEAYSLRNLTFQSDKLAAVEGMARIMGRTRKDAYVGGMWVGDLPQQLFWVGRLTTRPPEQTMFPSWSWASTQGACVMLFSAARFGRQNVAVRCEIDIADAARLTISCCASKTVIQKASMPLSDAAKTPLLAENNTHNSISNLQVLLVGAVAHHLLDVDTRAVVGLVIMDDNAELQEEECVCTSLLLMEETFHHPRRRCDVSIFLALLVSEIEGSSGGEYRRIGVAFILDPHVFQGRREHFTLL